MGYYPPSIKKLIDNMSQLPGIGAKSAERLAMHIVKSSGAFAETLAQSITEVKEKVRLCAGCFCLSDKELCPVCGDPGRDRSLLCIVEQPGDMIVIEKSGAFRGLYHVLAGRLSPMDGVGPSDIRIKELMERVERDSVRELIIATGTSVEGEATASYLVKKLAGSACTISRIATGVPVGGDLKYVDSLTLRRAMDTRRICGP